MSKDWRRGTKKLWDVQEERKELEEEEEKEQEEKKKKQEEEEQEEEENDKQMNKHTGRIRTSCSVVSPKTVFQTILFPAHWEKCDNIKKYFCTLYFVLFYF